MQRIDAPLVLYKPEALAQAFAGAHRRRIRWLQVVEAAEVIRLAQVSVRENGVTRRLFCRPESVELSIDCRLPEGMSCAVNGCGPLGSAPMPTNLMVCGHPVYVTAGRSERVPELLASAAFLRTLDAMALRAGEVLQTTHGVGVRMVAPDLARVERAFDLLSELTRAHPRPSTLHVALPSPLRPLEPVVAQWALHDPAEREAAVRSAHPVALRRLVVSASHYQARIDRFLARTRRPESDVTATLRAFLDTVARASLRLENVVDMREHRSRQRFPTDLR